MISSPAEADWLSYPVSKTLKDDLRGQRLLLSLLGSSPMTCSSPHTSVHSTLNDQPNEDDLNNVRPFLYSCTKTCLLAMISCSEVNSPMPFISQRVAWVCRVSVSDQFLGLSHVGDTGRRGDGSEGRSEGQKQVEWHRPFRHLTREPGRLSSRQQKQLFRRRARRLRNPRRTNSQTNRCSRGIRRRRPTFCLKMGKASRKVQQHGQQQGEGPCPDCAGIC